MPINFSMTFSCLEEVVDSPSRFSCLEEVVDSPSRLNSQEDVMLLAVGVQV